MSTSAAAIPRDHSFFWRRLHSLTGIVPVGAFLIEHIVSNAFAIRGAEAYNLQVKFLTGLPAVLALEWTLIYIPLLYHALYGLWVWWRGESNMLQYPWADNWMYTLQRYTGLVTFAFIVYHTVTMRFTGAHLMGNNNWQKAFAKVHEAMAVNWVVAFYVVGISFSSFHFAYGLWLFCCKWGITPGARAQRVFGYLFGAFGVALGALGLAALRAFMW